jgi:pimeloyl-ACP methyl ester carboxylesterase
MGAGTPVLLLHGIGGSSASFAAFQEELTDHTTIAWDAPGYGASDDPSAGDGEPADRYADAAFAMLRELGYRTAHVLGVSWGGVIATRMALRAPEKVRSLVLADSSRGSGRTAEGRAGMLRRVEELAAVGSRVFAHLRGPKLLASSAPEPLVDQVIETMSRVRLAGYRGAAAMMAATDHTDALRDIAVPTLVLVGEDDRVTGVVESEALAAGIPGARFAVVPGGGHAVCQENPREFAGRVRQFLADVDARVPLGT